MTPLRKPRPPHLRSSPSGAGQGAAPGGRRGGRAGARRPSPRLSGPRRERRRLPPWQALAAAAAVVSPGCVFANHYTTEVFADVWNARAILVLNIVDMVGEGKERIAVYRSASGDCARWEPVGVFAGRARAVAVRSRPGPEAAGGLWVFFDDGFARVYPLSEGDAGEGRTGEAFAGRTKAVRLPFDWTPRAACRGEGGSLWLVGLHRKRIAVARLPGGEGAEWEHSFPPGPSPAGAAGPGDAGGAEGAAPGGRRRRAPAGKRSPGKSGARDGLPAVRLRANSSGDLYVFWSVTPAGERAAESIQAARLRLARSGQALAEPEWEELPALAVRNEDFCAGPTRAAGGTRAGRSPDAGADAGTDGEADDVRGAEAGSIQGLLVRRHTERRGGAWVPGLLRAELDPSGPRWLEPRPAGPPRRKFLFGYIPSAAWVEWGAAELLFRSNTQRVEIKRREDGRWDTVRPASWVALHLTELAVLVAAAGAAVLVLAGAAGVVLRVSRLKRAAAGTLAGDARRGRGPPAEGLRSGAGEAEAHGGLELEAGMRLAPVAHRAVAAILDVWLVGGAAVFLVGFPEASANPLVPDPRALLTHGAALIALAAYGAVMEAVWGVTLGKLALGLKVASVGGGPARPGQAILRNVLKPLDLAPPYLGAVGLSAMTMTPLRQRLGDLAAGTVVVAPAPRKRTGRPA